MAVRPDVPDLVKMFHDGDYQSLAKSILSYQPKDEACHQLAWMFASIQENGIATAKDLRELAFAFLETGSNLPRCRYCRTGEGASCDCV